MKKTKLGFTLIELLAVIVIIGIVLLISIPLITNIIDNVKREAFKDSSAGLLKSAELSLSKSLLTDEEFPSFFEFENGVDISPVKLEFTGETPESGIIRINETSIALALYNGEYCVTKSYMDKSLTVTKTDESACVIPGEEALFSSFISNNKISNSTFSNTEGHTSTNSTISTSDNVLTLTGSGSSNVISLNNNLNLDVLEGDKLFFFIRLRPDTIVNDVSLSIKRSNDAGDINLVSVKPNLKVWNELYTIYTVPAGETNIESIKLTATYSSNTNSFIEFDGSKTRFGEFMALNLSEIDRLSDTDYSSKSADYIKENRYINTSVTSSALSAEPLAGRKYPTWTNPSVTDSVSLTRANEIMTWQHVLGKQTGITPVTVGGFPKISYVNDRAWTGPATVPYNTSYRDGALTYDWVTGNREQSVNLDNGYVTTQFRQLAVAYTSNTGNTTLRNSIRNAFDFLIRAQFPSGGWKQMYPDQDFAGSYHENSLTINDNLHVNVMSELRRIVNHDYPFNTDVIDSARYDQAVLAYNKGLEFIVDTQVEINGVKTIWGGQYDRDTLEPGFGRSFESDGLYSRESYAVLKFLLQIPAQDRSSDIETAIHYGVRWFQNNYLSDLYYDYQNEPYVMDSPGSYMWHRVNKFNGFEFVADYCNDRVKTDYFFEIATTYQSGYAWGTDAGGSLIGLNPN